MTHLRKVSGDKRSRSVLPRKSFVRSTLAIMFGTFCDVEHFAENAVKYPPYHIEREGGTAQYLSTGAYRTGSVEDTKARSLAQRFAIAARLEKRDTFAPRLPLPSRRPPNFMERPSRQEKSLMRTLCQGTYLLQVKASCTAKLTKSSSCSAVTSITTLHWANVREIATASAGTVEIW